MEKGGGKGGVGGPGGSGRAGWDVDPGVRPRTRKGGTCVEAALEDGLEGRRTLAPRNRLQATSRGGAVGAGRAAAGAVGGVPPGGGYNRVVVTGPGLTQSITCQDITTEPRLPAHVRHTHPVTYAHTDTGQHHPTRAHSCTFLTDTSTVTRVARTHLVLIHTVCPHKHACVHTPHSTHVCMFVSNSCPCACAHPRVQTSCAHTHARTLPASPVRTPTCTHNRYTRRLTHVPRTQPHAQHVHGTNTCTHAVTSRLRWLAPCARKQHLHMCPRESARGCRAADRSISDTAASCPGLCLCSCSVPPAWGGAGRASLGGGRGGWA